MAKFLQLKMKKTHNIPRKKSQKSETVQIGAEQSIQTPKHPHERKKLLEQQMAKKNSKARNLSKTLIYLNIYYLI